MTSSSEVYHRHAGLPSASQPSAGARKEPSARKMTSRHLFQFHRVSLSHPNDAPIASRPDDLRPLRPSPSTMHSLGRGEEGGCELAQRLGSRSYVEPGTRLSSTRPSGHVAWTTHPEFLGLAALLGAASASRSGASTLIHVRALGAWCFEVSGREVEPRLLAHVSVK